MGIFDGRGGPVNIAGQTIQPSAPVVSNGFGGFAPWGNYGATPVIPPIPPPAPLAPRALGAGLDIPALVAQAPTVAANTAGASSGPWTNPFYNAGNSVAGGGNARYDHTQPGSGIPGARTFSDGAALFDSYYNSRDSNTVYNDAVGWLRDKGFDPATASDQEKFTALDWVFRDRQRGNKKENFGIGDILGPALTVGSILAPDPLLGAALGAAGGGISSGGDPLGILLGGINGAGGIPIPGSQGTGGIPIPDIFSGSGDGSVPPPGTDPTPDDPQPQIPIIIPLPGGSAGSPGGQQPPYGDTPPQDDPPIIIPPTSPNNPSSNPVPSLPSDPTQYDVMQGGLLNMSGSYLAKPTPGPARALNYFDYHTDPFTRLI